MRRGTDGPQRRRRARRAAQTPALIGLGVMLLGALAAAPQVYGQEKDPRALQPPTALVALSADYVQRVNNALTQRTDNWGDKLIGLPDGPSLSSVKPLLVPANHAGTFQSGSPWYYLPFTYPATDPTRWTAQRNFSLHVADGSELISQWADSRATQHTTFFVRDGNERYGSDEARLADPTLVDGYQPMLVNSYRDAAGVPWQRESFVTRLTSGGPVVSMVKFTAQLPAGHTGSTLRMNVTRTGIERAVVSGNRLTLDGRTVAAFWGSGGAVGQWTAPNLRINYTGTGLAEIYFILPTEPSDIGTVVPSAALYQERKTAMMAYWNGILNVGAKIDLPETYAMDALRNTMLTNLVMGWNLTVGNGYEYQDENFAFVPEVAANVAAFGDFGYPASQKANLGEVLRRGQGVFVSWERGIKLQAAAQHYLQTNDSTVLVGNLSVFKSWLAEYVRQRDADPNGLLEKTRYASDIPTPVYGVHHQADAWRGMRDTGIALRLMGRPADAQPFLTEAAELRTALLSAVERSKTVLADGSVFVPVALLDPGSRQPYDQVTSSVLGGYWNLIMPYAMATGLFEPGSATALGLGKYLDTHGSLLLGLTRFNLAATDVGVCLNRPLDAWPATAGYKSSGIDQQYGYSLMRYYADNAKTDRLDLSFYGMLAHNFTPNTFVGGEGATISPCPQFGEYYRSQYWPPLSPNNSTYLKALRGILLTEDLAADGTPSRLRLAPASPRPWLADGKRVGVTGLPSSFGPVSYRIESDISNNIVNAHVDLPARQAGRAQLNGVTLYLRAPAGHRLSRVVANGAAVPFDASSQSVNLPSTPTSVDVVATYEDVPRDTAPSAEVTKLTSARGLREAGETVALNLEVEAIGTGVVSGTTEIRAPNGGTTSSATLPFTINSNEQFAWAKQSTSVQIPANAAPGTYRIEAVARPDGGPARTSVLTLRVAQPAAESYPDLVRSLAPVGYWRLGDASGQPAADASGNGGAGRYLGQVAYGQGGALADTTDQAVSLAGGYVDVPDSARLSLRGPYTIEAWVKDRSGGQQGIVEKYSGPANHGYVLRTSGGNKLEAWNLGATSYYKGPLSPASVRQDRWQHVALVYDGQNLTTYIDGKAQTATAATTAPTDGPATLKIGARGDDARARLDGWIDEVAVYDKALTPSQLDAHYVKAILGNRDS